MQQQDQYSSKLGACTQPGTPRAVEAPKELCELPYVHSIAMAEQKSEADLRR